MASQKNILIIFSDQHNAQVAGYAGDKLINTPNLDGLAAKSMRFKNTFCQSPVCTPSRMSFLTGKNIWNCSAWNNHWPLFPEHRTMAEYFREAGYATCLVGKMHFGGIDQYHGFQYRPYGDLLHGLGHQPDPIDMFPNSGGVAHAGPSQIPESMQQETIVSIEAAAWIREHMAANHDQPWLMCASYAKPHAPLVCPRRYFEKYLGKVRAIGLEDEDEAARLSYPSAQRKNYGLEEISPEQTQRARAAYWGAVEFLDDCIGLLLQQLERAGALENTLILYLSDHGDLIGNHGLWWKANYYEEALRVPFLLSGPEIPQGESCRQLVALTDIFPTLCGMNGLQPPENIDGVDITPAIRNGIAVRDHVISEYYGMGSLTQAYRSGSRGDSMRLIRTERFKYVNIHGQDDLFFDLDKDPREFHNAINEPGYAAYVKDLSARLNRNFSWDAVKARISADRERAVKFRSGKRPGMPNQYQLADGRVFDAEESLYRARWLQCETYGMSGIIPQMFH
jgi:choline-sulfatase